MRVTVVEGVMRLVDQRFVLVDVWVLFMGLLVQGLADGGFVLGELVWWMIPA